ncbi:CX chemokine ligand 34b, duplicate 11 [Micropterus dolomieu]|uniref:CX chemokine ligand 34b, duplicate 11 n=1 Tax=Micropterus dolomieu TaxID=147949 RepID=UPI001E8DC5FB|nr:CX chemokine ligand 34b, duplicate 11 [Micropterus dolomieu]
MHFSISCGLSFMCATLVIFLPVQGKLWHVTPESPFLHPIIPSCCMMVSDDHIRETVIACFEQREHTFPSCKIHAYIFVTQSQSKVCVDPNASWLPERLKKLEKKGITCEIL